MPAKVDRTWSNILRLVASGVFLYVIFLGLATANVGTNPAALWGPLFFAVGTISTIVLFFSSLAGLLWTNAKVMWDMVDKSAWWAAITLFALTLFVNPSGTPLAVNTWSWIVIVGLVISWLGSTM